MALLSDDAPNGGSFWGAVNVDGERALTAAQIEFIAARTQQPARFVLPLTEQTEAFGASGAKAQTLAILPGETIWTYGEPTRTDSLRVLRAVADGAASPDPNSVLLPVAAVVAEAIQQFGAADDHDVEVHFDALALDLEGARVGVPPAYRLDIGRLLVEN